MQLIEIHDFEKSLFNKSLDMSTFYQAFLVYCSKMTPIMPDKSQSQRFKSPRDHYKPPVDCGENSQGRSI